MSRRAEKYIKSQRLRFKRASVEDSNSSKEANDLSSTVLGKKHLETNKMTNEKTSMISEHSDNSLDRHDNNQEDPNQGDALDIRNHRGSNPVLYVLTPVFRKTVSYNPKSNLPMESIQGRVRMSSIHPNAIKKLKNIKLDTMKEEDQIEVNKSVT